MITIRRNIFETNSSSVHAISVTKECPRKLYYPQYERVEFSVGEFGWDHRTYYGTEDKASYLWTAIVHNFLKVIEDPETYTGWDGKEYHRNHYELDIENPDYILVKDAIIKALESIGIRKENIIFQETFEKTTYGFEMGYIDHCPDSSFFCDLVFKDDRLLRYLFNDKSCVSTGNDNDGSSDDLDYCEDLEWEFYKSN